MWMAQLSITSENYLMLSVIQQLPYLMLIGNMGKYKVFLNYYKSQSNQQQRKDSILMAHRFKTQPFLNCSLIDQDQIPNYSYKSQSSQLPSQSYIQDWSRLENFLQENFDTVKKNNSNDKINISQAKNQQKFGIKESEELKPKGTISLLRPKTQRNITQFICFNDRKIILKNKQIEQFIISRVQQNYRSVFCFQLLDKVIRKLFKEQNGFQIMEINLKSFNMTYTTMQEGKDGKKLEKNINYELIEKIYDYQQVNITRVLRPSKNTVEVKQKKNEQEQIEILSPDMIDFVYSYDKNRTIVQLKQAISIYYYQFVGKIILMSYYTFRMIDMKKRLCDIQEKPLEIYEEKMPAYIDRTFRKINANIISLNASSKIIINSSQGNQDKFQQTMICQTFLKGQLFLKIDKNKVIQRYNGGFLGYFASSRERSRSLLILTGMKIVQKYVYLQFTYKDRKELAVYFFTDANILNKFITTILTITRMFNHRLQLLQ